MPRKSTDELAAPEGEPLELNEHGEVVLPDIDRRLDYSDGGTGGWSYHQEQAGHPEQGGTTDARA